MRPYYAKDIDDIPIPLKFGTRLADEDALLPVEQKVLSSGPYHRVVDPLFCAVEEGAEQHALYRGPYRVATLDAGDAGGVLALVGEDGRAYVAGSSLEGALREAMRSPEGVATDKVTVCRCYYARLLPPRHGPLAVLKKHVAHASVVRVQRTCGGTYTSASPAEGGFYVETWFDDHEDCDWMPLVAMLAGEGADRRVEAARRACRRELMLEEAWYRECARERYREWEREDCTRDKLDDCMDCLMSEIDDRWYDAQDELDEYSGWADLL